GVAPPVRPPGRWKWRPLAARKPGYPAMGPGAACDGVSGRTAAGDGACQRAQRHTLRWAVGRAEQPERIPAEPPDFRFAGLQLIVVTEGPVLNPLSEGFDGGFLVKGPPGIASAPLVIGQVQLPG